METKPFLKSLGAWGLILLGAIEAAERTGQIPEGGAQTAATFGQAVAGLMAFWGRWRAEKPLSVTGG